MLLPEPVISITSMSWMRLSLILVRSRVKPVDYLGDKNDNILTGTTKDEIFVAGAGNDILTGNGGMDVLNAGTGDDTIIAT
jgi:Ca2+-binding RTX toxin-like protein